MKSNKLTAALIALGVLSLAGAANANSVVYLTGSTACRGNIFAAAVPGKIFDSGYPVTIFPAGATSSSGLICYEGKIGGVVTDLNCSWTGSEAGIAAVAGQTLQQNIDTGSGIQSYDIPGVPPKFLNPNSGFGAGSQDFLANIAGAPAYPDIAMADTSQAVSRTPESLYPLVDYGTVGIITFSVMKCYQSTHSDAYNNINNVTTAQMNQLLGGALKANIVTGVSTDNDEYIGVVGRNFGSGTRANTFLNFQYGLTTPVHQYVYGASLSAVYPPTPQPGVLTFTGSYAANQGMLDIADDGFDSGGSVKSTLNVDNAGSPLILLGYAGYGDAKGAYDFTTSPGGRAVFLPFNGVYLGDAEVINGSYSFWGQEHVLGSVGQSPSSQAGITAAAVKSAGR